MSWTTMVRQYLSDCFPADEKGNDPTVTADLSELHLMMEVNVNERRLMTEVNVNERRLMTEVNVNESRLITELHKEMLADEQQRAGYTIHKRLYFRNLVHLGEE
ncbi:hypothetical protein DINM_005898 [Dirofilaria immitis]|nr:hypothetical protein [Dirofilaria immitis]